jgi:hypothetical protein
MVSANCLIHIIVKSVILLSEIKMKHPLSVHRWFQWGKLMERHELQRVRRWWWDVIWELRIMFWWYEGDKTVWLVFCDGGLYFTTESHMNFNPSQITDQYNAGIGPKCTWTAFWLSSHTKLELHKWFLFTVRIFKILQFCYWLHLLQQATEGHIAELLLCVCWLDYTGSAVGA